MPDVLRKWTPRFFRPLKVGSNVKSKPDRLSAAYFGVYHTYSNKTIGNKVVDRFLQGKR